MFRTTLLLFVLLTTLGLGRASLRAEESREATRMTVIELDGMDDNNQARLLALRLYRVLGVVGVSTNLEAKKIFIDPQQNIDPAPRAMWEAIEDAGCEPIRLAGPFGVFTTKPR